jgi:hypothetical protein
MSLDRKALLADRRARLLFLRSWLGKQGTTRFDRMHARAWSNQLIKEAQFTGGLRGVGKLILATAHSPSNPRAWQLAWSRISRDAADDARLGPVARRVESGARSCGLASTWRKHGCRQTATQRAGETSRRTFRRRSCMVRFATVHRRREPATFRKGSDSPTKILIVNTDLVAGEVVDGEAVIINLSNGMYYTMEGVGAEVWQLIERRRPCSNGRRDRRALRVDRRRSSAIWGRRGRAGRGRARLEETGSSLPDGSPVEGPRATAAYTKPALVRYTDMSEVLALDPPLPELGVRRGSKS